MVGLLGATAFTFGLLHAVAAQIPQLDPTNNPQQNSYIYAANGTTTLAILRGSQSRVILNSDQISQYIKHAIVAIEDRNFYSEGGIDVRGILRALWVDLTHGAEVQGGSTITQQFIKNAYNGNAPTITRKLREAALAWQLERVWSKDKILTAYLNTIYFGNGAYGVEQACRIYFGKSAAQVNPAEAALLAAIPEDPTLYDPVDHPGDALQRRNLVLYEMYIQGYLSQAQYRQWLKWPMPKPQNVHLNPSESPVDPYFADYVGDQLVDKYGAAKVFGGGLKVVTTLDPGLQRLAEKAITQALPTSTGLSAALVTIDARTGQVLAMVGGQSYSKSQFNLATQGERQPGSSFKAFVLAAALNDGISPYTTFKSGTVAIDASGRVWVVNNFEHEDLGTVNLFKATAYSDNTIFAQLTNVIGPESVVKQAHAMGFTSPLQPYFSIALGAEPATPLEMARGYAALADGGYRDDSTLLGDQPDVINSITVTKPDGKPVTETNLTTKAKVPGLYKGDAAIEDRMLEGVVDYGTGTAARIPGWAVAGKTGTTENYGDAWFVGFTAPCTTAATTAPCTEPDLVTAVWVGYPNRYVPMLTQFHGEPVEGGTFPALIWKAFMEMALRYYHETPTPFPAAQIPAATPAKVTYGDAYGGNGQLELANSACQVSSTIYFFTGSAPTATAKCSATATPLGGRGAG